MAFQTGVLANATPFVVNIANSTLPAQVSLVSSAAGRKVRLSPNGGATFFDPVYDPDATSSANITVTIGAPVSHVEFTGIAGDVWSAR